MGLGFQQTLEVGSGLVFGLGWVECANEGEGKVGAEYVTRIGSKIGDAIEFESPPLISVITSAWP